MNRELSTFKALFRESIRLGLYSGEAKILLVRKFKVSQTELTYLDWGQIAILLSECRESRNASLYPVAKLCLLTGARWSEAEGVILSDLKNQGVNFLDTKNGSNRFVPLSESDFIYYLNFLKGGSFESCYSAFRSALDRSNIVTPSGQCAHILRHTFASHFIMNGGNVVTLQKILGHSSLDLTMRYAHLAPAYLQHAVMLNPLSGGRNVVGL